MSEKIHATYDRPDKKQWTTPLPYPPCWRDLSPIVVSKRLRSSRVPCCFLRFFFFSRFFVFCFLLLCYNCTTVEFTRPYFRAHLLLRGVNTGHDHLRFEQRPLQKHSRLGQSAVHRAYDALAHLGQRKKPRDKCEGTHYSRFPCRSTSRTHTQHTHIHNFFISAGGIPTQAIFSGDLCVMIGEWGVWGREGGRIRARCSSNLCRVK